MEESEQDNIREKLAGESGSCPQQSSRGAVAEGSEGSGGYCHRQWASHEQSNWAKQLICPRIN